MCVCVCEGMEGSNKETGTQREAVQLFDGIAKFLHCTLLCKNSVSHHLISSLVVVVVVVVVDAALVCCV
jgi:hypothetical protein